MHKKKTDTGAAVASVHDERTSRAHLNGLYRKRRLDRTSGHNSDAALMYDDPAYYGYSCVKYKYCFQLLYGKTVLEGLVKVRKML